MQTIFWIDVMMNRMAQREQGVRTEDCPEKIHLSAIADILQPRRFEYLRTVWLELYSACLRIQTIHKRSWMRHGIEMLHPNDRYTREGPCCHNFRRVRIRGIQRLLSIHQGATLFDLQIICRIIGPELFEEEDRREEGSPCHTLHNEGTEP